MPVRRRRVLRWLIVGLCVFAAAVAGYRWWDRSPEEGFRQAWKALDRGDLPKAAAIIRALDDRSRNEPRVRLLRGGYLMKRGDYAGALEQLSGVEAAGSLREPVLLMTGECLYRQGRLLEAERPLRRLAEEFPRNDRAHRWLAAIYYDLGAMNGALDELQILSRLRPDDFAAHRLMGRIYDDFEKYAKAVTHYRAALERNPPAPMQTSLSRNLARALIEEHRYEEALEVLEGFETSATVFALRAESHWALGKSERARTLLERGRELDPDRKDVLLMQARIHIAEGDPHSAVAPLQRVLKQDPHNVECRYQLALAFRQLGREDEYQAQMARKKKSEALRSRLSELNRKAIDRPRDAELREEIAELCDQLNKPELARTWRRAARACRRRRADSTPSGPRS